MQCKIAVSVPFQELLSWGESLLPFKNTPCHIKKIHPYPPAPSGRYPQSSTDLPFFILAAQVSQQRSSGSLEPSEIHPGWCWVCGWWQWVNIVSGWKEQGYHTGPEVKKWCLPRLSQQSWCSQAGPLLFSPAGTADIWCGIVLFLHPAPAELAAIQPAQHCNYSFSLPLSALSVCSSVCTFRKADWNQKFTIPSSSQCISYSN